MIVLQIDPNYAGPEYSIMDGNGGFFDSDVLIIQIFWSALLFVFAYNYGKWSMIKLNHSKRLSLLVVSPLFILIYKIESWMVFHSVSLFRNAAYGGEHAGYGFVDWNVPSFMIVTFFALGYIRSLVGPRSSGQGSVRTS